MQTEKQNKTKQKYKSLLIVFFMSTIELNRTIEKNQYKLMITSKEKYYSYVDTSFEREYCLQYKDDREGI